MTKDPVILALADRLRAGRAHFRGATEEEARAQQARALAGETKEPVPEAPAIPKDAQLEAMAAELRASRATFRYVPSSEAYAQQARSLAGEVRPSTPLRELQAAAHAREADPERLARSVSQSLRVEGVDVSPERVAGLMARDAGTPKR